MKTLKGHLMIYGATGEGPEYVFYSDEARGGFYNTYSINRGIIELKIMNPYGDLIITLNQKQAHGAWQMMHMDRIEAKPVFDSFAKRYPAEITIRKDTKSWGEQ